MLFRYLESAARALNTRLDVDTDVAVCEKGCKMPAYDLKSHTPLLFYSLLRRAAKTLLFEICAKKDLFGIVFWMAASELNTQKQGPCLNSYKQKKTSKTKK